MLALTVNAGSSSVKVRLLEDTEVVNAQLDLPVGDTGLDAQALMDGLAEWPTPEVIGHRVAHGGARFTGPAIIDADVYRHIDELSDLAPLHQKLALAGIDAMRTLYPAVVNVASFDTAFHATIPPAASTYALPQDWSDRYGIRRFGFHGLSHAYCARRAAQLVGAPLAGLRIVTCHLGAGASLAAVVGGRSVDTTMGFTPLEGLVMATRSGSVDVGLVLWLAEHQHLSVHDIATTLEHRSGLLGLAGTGDMREVEANAAAGDMRATLAIEVYVHRLAGAVAAMAAAAGGIDVLAFTGGVGENSAAVRHKTADRLAFLGVALSDAANGDASGVDREVTRVSNGVTAGMTAGVRTVIVGAREDIQIAREAHSVGSSSGPAGTGPASGNHQRNSDR